MLKRVFYVSLIAEKTSRVDVQAIVSSSTVWNRRHDMTGLLVASRRNFAQVLEGREAQMDLVLQRIRGDPHHRAMHVQSDETITRRLCGAWAMVYIQRDDLSDDLERLHAGSGGSLAAAAMLEAMVKAGQDFLPAL